jgi:DNA-binding HxlR family transcriptional regulator
VDARELDSTRCSVARTAALVGDAWTVLVLRDLFNGIRRFDDLAQHLGIARNVLVRRLGALVDAGLVDRVPYREPGRRERHEYRLTPAGRDLRPVILAMLEYGDRHLAGADGPPVRVEHVGLRRAGARRGALRAGHLVESGTRLRSCPDPAPAAWAEPRGYPRAWVTTNAPPPSRLPPDVLFDYLSDVGNLPHYFAAMKSAEPGEGNEVHTVAEVDGHRVEGDAWFTAEDGSRSMRWGSEGENDYAGELSVAGHGTARASPSSCTPATGSPRRSRAGSRRHWRRSSATSRGTPTRLRPDPGRAQVRGSRRIGWSGGTSTSTIRTPSGSSIHISRSPHGSSRGPRTTCAARSAWAAVTSRTCSHSATPPPGPSSEDPATSM